MRVVKVKRLNPQAVLPERVTEGAAGLDLYALLDAPLIIKPFEQLLVPTGLAIELPGADTAAFIYARSGLACRHGITLSNSVGVVDSDYRGEIKVSLVNLSNRPYTLQPAERIAQMVIQPVFPVTVEETQILGETGRGAGGFGSTGRI